MLSKLARPQRQRAFSRVAKRGVEPLEARIAPAANAWVGLTSGDWNNPANWSDGVPTSDDDVTIDPVGALTITISDGARVAATISLPGDDVLQMTGGSLNITAASSVTNLSLLGGTLIATGPLTLTGASQFSGVSTVLSGSVRNEGTLAITSGEPDIRDGTLINAGVLVHGDATLDFGSGGALINAEDGLYDLQNSGTGGFLRVIAGGVVGFTNLGILRKSGGSGGLASGGVPFSNTGGIIEVNAGTLQLNSPGAWQSATFNIASGRTLFFDGTSATFSGTFSGTGEGVVRLGSGTMTVGAGGLTLNIAGGGFEFGGDNTTITGGTVTNTGNFKITNNSPNLIGTTLLNNAMIIHGNGTGLDFGTGGALVNASTGLYDLQNADSGNFLRAIAGGAIGFSNFGTFRKSVGTGHFASGGTPFSNPGGTIEVVAGTLQFNSPGSWQDSTLNVSPGKTLFFDDTSATFSGTFSGTGAGVVRLGSGTMTIGAGGLALNMASGFEFGGDGTTITGGTVTNTGIFRITNNSPNLIGTTLLNNATIIHGSGTGLDFGTAGALINSVGALYDLQNADSGSFLRAIAGGALGFTNFGTFRKSVGTGHLASGGAPFSNPGGMVEVSAGTLQFNSPGSWQDSTFTVGTGNTVFFDDTSATFTGTFTGAGTGVVRLGSGTMTIGAGGLALNIAGGFEFGGDNTTITGGTVTNTGIFRITNNSPNLIGTTLRNNATIIHGSGTGLDFGTNGALINEVGALYDLQTTGTGDILRVISGGPIGFTNFGTFRKSVGSGSLFTGTVPFSNPAGGIIQITADGGSLEFTGPGTWTSPVFDIAAGAVVFRGADKIIGGTWTGSGAGHLEFSTGNFFPAVGDVTFAMPANDFFRIEDDFTLANGTAINIGTIKIHRGTPNLSGATLVNTGTIIHGEAVLDFGTGGAVVNEVGASYEVQKIGTTSFTRVIAGGPTGITNRGTFHKTVGGGTQSTASVPFSNFGGAIEVSEGALQFNSPGTWQDATFSISSGSTVFFDDTTATFTGTFSGTGAGVVRLGSGTMTIGTAGLTLNIAGGGFEFGGDTTTIAGSTVTNTGIFRITNNSPNLIGTTLLNNATIIHGSGTGLDFGTAGALVNASGALYDLQNADSGSFLRAIAGGALGFTNFGTFRKSGGTGNLATGGAPFSNLDGTIEVVAGTLQFNSPGTWEDGTFNVSSNTTVFFDNTSATFTGTVSGTGAGVVRMGSGTMTIGATGLTLNITGGGFEFGGDGTTITGGTVTNTGIFRITNNSPNIVGTTLLNNATIIHGSGTGLDFGTAGALINAVGALYDLQNADSGAFLRVIAGGALGFTNLGTFRKSGGAGDLASGGAPFSNTGGTIEVVSGTLQFNSPGSWEGGTLNVSPGRTLFFDNTTAVFSGALSGSGEGVVRLGAGTMTVGATGLNLNITGGGFEFGGDGTTITGGTATNTGIFRITNNSPNLIGTTLLNNATIIHGSGTGLDFGTAGALVNAVGALYDLQNADSGSFLRAIAGGALGFTNFGTFRKSVGLGALSFGGVALNNAGVVESLAGDLIITPNTTQLSGATLSGGTWRVAGGRILFPNNLTTNAGTVILEPGGDIPQLATLTTNSGTFALAGGRDFTRNSDFTNTGIVRLGPGSDFNVQTFTQSGPGAVLEIGLGTEAAGTSGKLNVAGVAALGGTLRAAAPSDFTAAVGELFPALTFASRTSDFAIFEGIDSDGIPIFDIDSTPTSITLRAIARTVISISDASIVEGSSGTVNAVFTVTLSAASRVEVAVTLTTLSDTATAGLDFTALPPAILTFAPGETSKTVSIPVRADALVEGTETFFLQASNPLRSLLPDTTAIGTITNDDAPVVKGSTLTFDDLDGDRITVSLTGGAKIEPGDITFKPDGTVAMVDLTRFATTSQNPINLTITATTPRGQSGDGLANIGLVNATGVDLGTVKVKGNVDQIFAGDNNPSKPAIKSLTIFGSLGPSLPGEDPANTEILGDVRALAIRGSVRNASIEITGAAGTIKIDGDLTGEGGMALGAVQEFAETGSVPRVGGGLPFGAVVATSVKTFTVGGAVRGASITSAGDVGNVSVRGNMTNSSLVSGGVIRVVKVFGELVSDDAAQPTIITALAKLAPGKAANAVGINSFTVNRDVENALILIGYDKDRMGINPDASVGKVKVGGNWMASSLAAGVLDGGGDGFGQNDLNIAEAPADKVLARIASIVIKGTATGSAAQGDHFGIVAELITSARINGVKIPLVKNQPDNILLNAIPGVGVDNDDFRMVEVTRPVI